MCARVCIPGENASSGGHGVGDLRQTEAQPLGKENKAGVARPRTQLGDAIAGEEKPVKSTLGACMPGMAGLRLGRASGKLKPAHFPHPPSAGSAHTQHACGSSLLLLHRRPELVIFFTSLPSRLIINS